jgi:mono/diheme cytochrome c family protein
MNKKLFAGVLTLALGLVSCTKNQPANTQNPLVTRGRVIYSTNCTACHHQNPKLPGSIGPDVYGSSLELLTARMLKAAYPAGYTPKRSTAQMVALPHLEKEIEALHQYLNSELN